MGLELVLRRVHHTQRTLDRKFKAGALSLGLRNEANVAQVRILSGITRRVTATLLERGGFFTQSVFYTFCILDLYVVLPLQRQV